MTIATDISHRCHASCLVCGSKRPDGLGLRFEPHGDGGVVAAFGCSAAFQGYPDRVHGGVLALLLDAAMTHCLFARGIVGLTAKLSIRYHRRVAIDVPAAVRARIVDAEPPLYYLESEVVQGEETCATARGTFWDSAAGESAHETPPGPLDASDEWPRSTAIEMQRRSS